ncbi:hypothetical protein [Companilactobacillus sp. HBUAS59699]|uniref:hypothetical protein n=1 Tax=Companilactobacillus sp. HBUAS59699 TaxID=3109358 RepID=UPI002FEF703A
MNLLMKIDRYLGIFLLVVAVLGFIFHWFTTNYLWSAAGAGLLLIVISFTSDKKDPKEKTHGRQ